MANCAICNRPLTDPQSVKQGMGPICFNRIMAKAKMKQDEFEDNLLSIDEYPLDESVVLMRDAGQLDDAGMYYLKVPRKSTNVPHIVGRHSPNGYEWGYGGSGPSELALNICEYYVRILKNEGYAVGSTHENRQPGFGHVHNATELVYQDFKRDFIAGIDRAGGTIPANEIVGWLKSRLEKQTQLF